MSRRPYVIGLTGNIAAGKSVVASMLACRGAEVLDADRLAHRVLMRGTPAWERVVVHFGLQVLNPKGEIDRARLAGTVFRDPVELAWLEALIYPDLFLLLDDLIGRSSAPVVVVEGIKLIESGVGERLCDALWVVTAPREVRVRRLIEGRGLAREDAELRVDAQSPEERKVARADLVICNDGTLSSLEDQVAVGWERVVKGLNLP